MIPVGPELPTEGIYLWLWFNEFSWGLKADGMGPVIASWVDVQAWCEAMLLDLDPWEKRLLVMLARIRASIEGEKMQREAKQKQQQQARGK